MTTTTAGRVTLLTACLLIALQPSFLTRVAAQEPSDVVRLSLESQTAWTSPQDPMLRVAVLAENTGTLTLDELALGLTIGSAITSRTHYEASIDGGPGDFPAFAGTQAIEGGLAPGQTRTLSMQVDVSTVGGISSIDSAVYPVRVDVRSHGLVVGALTSAEIHMVRTPQSPLLTAWWTEFSWPPPLDHERRLTDPSIEAALSPEGTLTKQAEAFVALSVEQIASARVDVVVDPGMLDQLAAMSGGYRRVDGTEVAKGEGPAAGAEQLLRMLVTIANDPDVEMSSMPYSAPEVPSLLTSGIARDLARQYELGRATTAEHLGQFPVVAVARPPAGALSTQAISAIAAEGSSILLANPDTIDRPTDEIQSAPPPTAVLPTETGSVVNAVLPDPGTQALLAREELLEDPIRAAQLVLGELATIWREEPVPAPPKVRGIALALHAGLPAGIWDPITRRLASAPFLSTVTATELISQVYPPGQPATLERPSVAAFSAGYAEAIKQARRKNDAYRSMVPPDYEEPARLDRQLLWAESGAYLANELSGRPWIDDVNRTIDSVFLGLQPDTSQVYTLTAGTGEIPIRMGDPGNETLTVIVQLRSARFRFPEGSEQTVTLTRPDQIVTFLVEARASGRGRVQVLIRAPAGPEIGRHTLVVRVAAINRVAFIVTIAAALVLLGLWSRRLFRRQKS
jgi:hypothetical protein